MNPLALTPVWLRRTRYVGTLALILALSVSAHWLALSLVPFRLTAQESEPERLRPDSPRASVVLWTPSDNAASQRENRAMAVFDPTLIAFSGDRGFAHRVSRGMPPITYQPQVQQQQPRLTDSTQFTLTRAPTVTVLPLAQELAAHWTKPLPPPQETESLLLPLPTEPPPVLELRGSIASRPLLVGLKIPESAVPPAQLIRFEFAVDGNGKVCNVILKGKGSGNEETDRLAADALSRCTFAPANVAPRPIGVEFPAPQPHLEWGEAVIFWKAKARPPVQPDTP